MINILINSPPSPSRVGVDFVQIRASIRILSSASTGCASQLKSPITIHMGERPQSVLPILNTYVSTLVALQNKLHPSNKHLPRQPEYSFIPKSDSKYRLSDQNKPSVKHHGKSPSYPDLFLRCFVVDLEAENEDTLRADEAAIRQLPSELRSSHCLPYPIASPSDPLINSEHFCKSIHRYPQN